MNGEGLSSQGRPLTAWLDHRITDTNIPPVKHSTVLKNDLSGGRTLWPTRLRAGSDDDDDDDDASSGQKIDGSKSNRNRYRPCCQCATWRDTVSTT